MTLLCAVARISEISLYTDHVSAAYTWGLYKRELKTLRHRGCVEVFGVMASHHSSSSAMIIASERQKFRG